MLSRYDSGELHVHLSRMISKARWNVAGTFISSKGIRLKWYVPAWLVKVVLSLIFMCNKNLPVSLAGV